MNVVSPSMADDFLSRWSRKKQLDHQISNLARARPEGQESPVQTTSDADQDVSSATAGPAAPSVASRSQPQGASDEASGAEPSPAMDEARSLPVGADVRRFMQSDVSEDVRREALQKLFSDPMYNVISEMDDYVEDYSNLPNLTRAELKTLNHVKGLFLFEDPPWKIEAEAREREAALNPPVPDDALQEESAANTITVSPPPPHLGRIRPAGEASEVQEDEAGLSGPVSHRSDVPLAGRRYQPTKRQDNP
jgi:hypothetical protein